MNRRPSVLVIFLTVFIDLIGFGIVVPLLPVYSRQYEANGLILGIIGASFSAMQFLFSPVWGRLSDRVGRRPILLISTAGSAISYALFALGSGFENAHAALWTLFLSRALAGACGGNITVAQAYIADITPPENRSRRMGLIGMAFGLGFIFGPAIGGIGLKYLGHAGPGWIAAALCASNFLLAAFILAESLQAGSGHANERPRFKQWRHILAQPKIGLLVLIFFLATFAFSCFEFTLPWLVSDNFHLGITRDTIKPITTIIYLFVFCGLIGAVVQGGLIGRLVKKFGEPKLIALSLFLTGISLALLPFVKGNGELLLSALFRSGGWPWIEMLLVLALLAVGSSLTRAPLFGLLSNLAPPNEQGATIGVAQSASSLARILGPLFAAPLYTYVPALPYLVCGIVSIFAGALAMQRLGKGNEGVVGESTAKVVG